MTPAAALTDPRDPPERREEKLRRIVEALMRRVEQDTEAGGPSWHHFETAAALESEVRQRTRDLEAALDLLNRSNARLSEAKREAERARADLANALEAVHEGFALFSPEDTLVLRNSRFSAALPDVARALLPGLGFEDYVRIVAQSPDLVTPAGTTREDWVRRRLRAHADRHVNFTVELAGDRWVQVSEQRTPDNGTAILQTDVTDMVREERRERDRRLDDQSRIVRATLDHINQGVAIFDAACCLVGWNDRLRALLQPPARLLRKGTSFETLAAHFSADQRLSDAVDPVRLPLWVARGPGRPPLALELRREGGLVLDLFCQEMPDGGFVISLSDVTAERSAIAAMHRANESLEQRVLDRTLELSAARDEAERANASKSRFVAAASHDLLQPLNAAKLFIASLAGTGLTAQQSVLADRIQSAFESVETLLGSLLDISRLDAGRASADVSAFPIARVLRPIADEFRPLAERKGLDLRVMPSGAVVLSDPAYLRRILQNLVGNAIRYTRQGRVLVGLRRQGGAVRIEVHDTGPGIPPDKREEVFREFRRLDTSAEGPPGMGLGLAIVERACALLGHGIALESEVGRGTTFAVTVPCAATACPGEETLRIPDPAGGADLSDMIALVVENDPAVRTGMVALLESWGVAAFEAEGPAAARAILDEAGIAPDIVLADLHLDAEADGLDVIAEIRARHGPVPAILITADRSEAVAARARAGAVPLLQKPIGPPRLRAMLGWARAGRSGRSG